MHKHVHTHTIIICELMVITILMMMVMSVSELKQAVRKSIGAFATPDFIVFADLPKVMR